MAEKCSCGYTLGMQDEIYAELCDYHANAPEVVRKLADAIKPFASFLRSFPSGEGDPVRKVTAKQVRDAKAALEAAQPYLDALEALMKASTGDERR